MLAPLGAGGMGEVFYDVSADATPFLWSERVPGHSARMRVVLNWEPR